MFKAKLYCPSHIMVGAGLRRGVPYLTTAKFYISTFRKRHFPVSYQQLCLGHGGERHGA